MADLKIVDMIRKHGFFVVFAGLIVFLPLLWVFPSRGLIALYFDNAEWQGEPVITQQERLVNLDVVAQRQDTFPQSNFSVTWGGWIRIDREGEYAFSTESDDGSSLKIDGKIVVNNGGYHPERRASGTIFLTRGLHSFQVNYMQGAGAYKLQIFWTPPGQTENWIPPDVLYPTPFPIRGIGFLTRHLKSVYLCVWLSFFFLLFTKLVKKRNHIRPLLKTCLQNLVLSLISLLIFCVCAEGIIRLAIALREKQKDVQSLLEESQKTELHGSTRTYSLKGIVQGSPHKDVVYALKPNLRGIFRDVPLSTNSRGLRDYEYSYRKPDNTFRIVGLGDSSLFGWGVKLEDTSLKVLERKLNELSSGKKYEVINFAVPGYNTAIEVEVFKQECLRYDPDLVIMHFNTNDYDVPGFMKPSENYATLRKSYLFEFIYERYQMLQGVQEHEMIPFVFDRTVRLEESERLHEDPNFPEEYRHLVGLQGFLRAIESLVHETTTRNIPLLVYVIKAYPGLDPNYTPDKFRDEQLRVITQLSEEHGFFLLNMYSHYMTYLAQNPARDQKVFWVTPEDSHPSALAHRIEAEAFVEFLVEHKLTPLSENQVARNK